MTDKQKAKAYIAVVQAIADTIRELKQIPSGHLYAHIQSKVSLEVYQSIINLLKESGRVKEENYLLSWVD